MRKAGSVGEPDHDVVEPHAREERHAVPLRLAMPGDRVATTGELLP